MPICYNNDIPLGLKQHLALVPKLQHSPRSQAPLGNEPVPEAPASFRFGNKTMANAGKDMCQSHGKHPFLSPFQGWLCYSIYQGLYPWLYPFSPSGMLSSEEALRCEGESCRRLDCIDISNSGEYGIIIFWWIRFQTGSNEKTSILSGGG